MGRGQQYPATAPAPEALPSKAGALTPNRNALRTLAGAGLFPQQPPSQPCPARVSTVYTGPSVANPALPVPEGCPTYSNLGRAACGSPGLARQATHWSTKVAVPAPHTLSGVGRPPAAEQVVGQGDPGPLGQLLASPAWGKCSMPGTTEMARDHPTPHGDLGAETSAGPVSAGGSSPAVLRPREPLAAPAPGPDLQPTSPGCPTSGIAKKNKRSLWLAFFHCLVRPPAQGAGAASWAAGFPSAGSGTRPARMARGGARLPEGLACSSQSRGSPVPPR